MKTAIFITARVGSSRLPNKHFMPVGKKPIMQYLIDRINERFDYDLPIYIVTGNSRENKVFSTSFENCQFYYGDDRNIPARHLAAAESYKVAHVIAVDGDDILCSPESMSYVGEMLDRMECVKTEGLPLGLNCFGYRTEYLRESMRFVDKKVLETGWTRIFPNITKVKMKSRDRPFLRFTLDYPRDLQFFDKIIQGMGPLLLKATDDQIIDFVLKTKSYKENEALAEQYMANFQKGVDAE